MIDWFTYVDIAFRLCPAAALLYLMWLLVQGTLPDLNPDQARAKYACQKCFRWECEHGTFEPPI